MRSGSWCSGWAGPARSSYVHDVWAAVLVGAAVMDVMRSW